MIMLTRSSERNFNPKRKTSNSQNCMYFFMFYACNVHQRMTPERVIKVKYVSKKRVKVKCVSKKGLE